MNKRTKDYLISFFCIALIFALQGCETLIHTPKSKTISNYEKALDSYIRGDFENAKEFAEQIDSEDADYNSAQKLIKKIDILKSNIAEKYMAIGKLYEGAGIISKAEIEYRKANELFSDDNKISVKIDRLSVEKKEKIVRIDRPVENPDSTPSTTPAKISQSPETPTKPQDVDPQKDQISVTSIPARSKTIKAASGKSKSVASIPARPKTIKAASGKSKKELFLEKRYAKGKKLYGSGKLSKAITELNKILKVDPSYKDTNELITEIKTKRKEFVETHLKKGIHFYQIESLEKAVKEWDKVLEEDADNIKAIQYKLKANNIIEKIKEIKNSAGKSTPEKQNRENRTGKSAAK